MASIQQRSDASAIVYNHVGAFEYNPRHLPALLGDVMYDCIGIFIYAADKERPNPIYSHWWVGVHEIEWEWN